MSPGLPVMLSVGSQAAIWLVASGYGIVPDVQTIFQIDPG